MNPRSMASIASSRCHKSLMVATNTSKLNPSNLTLGSLIIMFRPFAMFMGGKCEEIPNSVIFSSLYISAWAVTLDKRVKTHSTSCCFIIGIKCSSLSEQGPAKIVPNTHIFPQRGNPDLANFLQNCSALDLESLILHDLPAKAMS